MHGGRDEDEPAGRQASRHGPAHGGRPPARRVGYSRAGSRPVSPAARRAGYALTCLLAAASLTVSCLAYLGVSALRSIGNSDAIVSGPSTGPQNILLMGLESRTYWNGTILPWDILSHLHAGSERAVAAGAGGNDTNTLILIHIFANGTRAVGFSIPRDDWVNFAGTAGPQQQGKIDQAYGVSLFYTEQQLKARDPGMSRNTAAFLGNEAGQHAAVDTVEALTGVHIDHFAAVNLYGFYELAKVLGGVEVCLKHAVHDVNSGADFPAGYQHLNAAQALAFVRQRDGLPNGDLDRTHRQQAFLDSVIHQLRQEGVMDDLTKISALLDVAKHYVMADYGWNLLDFAAEARNLTSGNIVFHTLPIEGYATIDHQDANVVDPAYIKEIVKAAFSPTPPAPRHTARASGRGHGRATPVPASSVASTPASAPVAIPTTGPQGGSVSAENGIPCVN
jgi:LCP family protein required for cell wall assembly